MQIFKNNWARFGLILLAVLLVSGLIAYLLVRLNVFSQEPVYSIVYLRTGDIYVGQFKLFPFPRLSDDSWILQQDSQGRIVFNPISAAVWQPKGSVRINPFQIVFWAKISSESQLVKLIKNQPNRQDQPQGLNLFSPSPSP
ncbi:MAG: hypothetical protein AB1721_01065 [Patescibacteria group bacterium]